MSSAACSTVSSLQSAKGARGSVLRYTAALVFLMAVAGLLRFTAIDRPFIGQDEVLPAFIACYEPGYWWMISFYSTGGIIQFVAWASALVLTSLGVAMTEFWWIAPIAALGTLQVPMTFVLACRLGCRKPLALAAAAVMAVLPIHVMQSRLALSHEVLAVFWLSAATLAMLHLFERPSVRRGLWASFCCGVYLASHHYVIPFAVYFIAICAMSAPSSEKTPLQAVRQGATTFFRYGGFVFPLLATPVVLLSLAYTFVHRQPPPMPDLRVAEFIKNLHRCAGGVVATVLLIALPIGLIRTRLGSRALLFCVVSGVGYLAPLFLSDAGDHHEVSQYSMVGLHFLVLAAALSLSSFSPPRWIGLLAAIAGAAAWAVCLTTAVATVFVGWSSPLAVALKKGAVEADTGVKAAGFYIRRFADPDARLLSIHDKLNRYSAAYYLRGGDVDRVYVLNSDRSATSRAKLFAEFAAEVEIVVVSRDLLDLVRRDGRFEEKFVIRCQGEPCVWVFALPETKIPRGSAAATDYNREFDREYAPRTVPILQREGFPPTHGTARRVDEFDADELGWAY